jgi:tetratricopeptide (TPR) repeat protein
MNPEPTPNPSENSETETTVNQTLEQRVEVMKREIDALQIAMSGQSKPWYQNVPVLLSAIALFFSFGTTFVSYHRTNIQDIQNARAELRGLLQRLAALPKENVEAAAKYASDPASRNLISSFINQENTLLVHNAAELAKKLPPKSVSATEYYGIAVGLQAAYDLNGAVQFLNYAIASDPDFNIEIACLRMSANLKFIQGRPDAGRVDYQKALDIFSKYSQYDPLTRANTNVMTELSWAYSEANSNGFGLANQHVESAQKIVDPLPAAPGVDGLKSQVSQARGQILSGAPLPNPIQLTIPTPSPSRR